MRETSTVCASAEVLSCTSCVFLHPVNAAISIRELKIEVFMIVSFFYNTLTDVVLLRTCFVMRRKRKKCGQKKSAVSRADSGGRLPYKAFILCVSSTRGQSQYGLGN